jgi:toxin HigB-1
VIKSFRSANAQALLNDYSVARWRAIERPARRKLIYLNQARSLQDLMAPPGNRLEALKGNRKGQHSIRINDQWRICFRWSDGHAHDVEIVDYHG